MFESQNLAYCGYRKIDNDDLLALYNDYAVQKTLVSDFVVPRSDAYKETIEGWGMKNLMFVIVRYKPTWEFVGQTAIWMQNEKNRDARLGIAIGSAWWGKGFGTEIVQWVVAHSFRHFNLHRMSLDVLASNGSALTIYKKACVHINCVYRANVLSCGGVQGIRAGRCAPQGELGGRAVDRCHTDGNPG